MSSYLQGTGPIALAHRGGAKEVRENSRAAVEHTVGLGLRYLETDVRATADGVVVLAHDPTLERVAGIPAAVADLSFAELAARTTESGAPVLRLAEVLAEFPDLRLNIDAKEDAVVDPLLAELRRADALDRVCLASFSNARLARVRAALGPAVATSLGRGDVLRLLAAARLPGPARQAALATVPGPAAGAVCVQVPVRHRGVPVTTPALIRAAHDHGLAVHTWTVDEPAEMVRLLDLGVDGIVTDRPRVLREVLTARGPWH